MADRRETTERGERKRMRPEARPAEPMGTERVRSEAMRDADPGGGEQAGEAVGGITGTLAGAGIGSAAGPIGTIIGGIAGAVGGWWVGEKLGRAAEDWDEQEPTYRQHFDSEDRRDLDYGTATIGYGVGHMAGHNPDYRDRPFSEVEPHIRDNWADRENDYETLRPYVVYGYACTSRAGSTGEPEERR